MGLHTGTPHLSEEGYVGVDVHKGARIAAAAHGGQVVLSKETLALLGDDVALVDLGEHRLKDFTESAWIFQLGDERFPPLKTISNTNLPRPASSFVGREREVRDIVSLLRDGARLVTLSGPGGSGKTRLAIESAAELVPDFRNGVFWVGLASLRDPALVPETVAQTLGAKNGLAEHVGERELLLLLDNFEQVVEAAPELASLLESSPNLRLLVTSRELLRTRGEVEYPVPPLGDEEAVELFCQRSQLEPEETITELCRRLDDLPLAVELAAARTSALSPSQILERLSQRLDLLKGGRDAEARQQTLRATIAWSYDLLSDDEKILFRRLAIFLGGCTLEAAEAVAGADLDTLQSLVDKSLVRFTDQRYWLLETIQEYALERLEESGEADQLARWHADYFVAVAEEAEPHLLGVRPQEWLERLERDQDNVRTALDWLEAAGEIESAMGLGGAIFEFWCLRSRYAEGWRRLERLLELDVRPTPARAKALHGSTHLAPGVGPEAAEAYHRRAEEALAIHRELGDPWGIAFAEFEFALTFTHTEDFASALPLFEESIGRLREVGDEHRALQAIRLLAWCCRETGDVERSNALYEELLRDARAAGDEQMASVALSLLGGAAADEGRFAEALALLHEAYLFDREFGDETEVFTDLLRFARTLALAGRAHDAVKLLASSEAKRAEVDVPYPAWVARLLRDQADESARGQLDEKAYSAAWERGFRLSPDEAVALALGSLGQDE
jgi:predicted ATPase